jgi:serine O-acetyltransferase
MVYKGHEKTNGKPMIEQLKFLVIDLKRWKCASFKGLFYTFFEQAVWATVIYRISRVIFLVNIPVLKIFLRLVSFLMFKISEFFFGVSIPPGTDIGPGLYIGHTGLVLISPEAKAGKNLSIGPGVLIGSRGGGSLGAPVIGDDVYIGVGAKILGKITIGSNVRIGANSVVVGNVPDNVTMFGVPAKIVGPVFSPKKRKG